jgi:hypothetical protein
MMRYVKLTMTLGVMVWNAAWRNWKEEWIAVGRLLSICIRVEYDAIIIGGRGGKSGCEAACCSAAAAASGEGW